MQKVSSILGYYSTVPKKLVLLVIFIFAINLAALTFIDFFFNFNIWIPVIIVSIPFLSFIIYGICAFFAKNSLGWFTHCWYHRKAPFILRYLPRPTMNPEIDIQKIKATAKPGDIILRTYHNYLDSIVFSENSFFTHVGICNGKADVVDAVLHSTGQHGVHEVPLEYFCQCDDVAILRFSLDQNKEETEVLNYINAQLDEETTHDERRIFKNLQKKGKEELMTISKGQYDDFLEYSNSVVLERAEAVKKRGTPYDFSFDFNNFETMSCVEYVWYCYKSLYPLHRIKVENFEFFNWIKMRVMIPDVFIKNDFFSYVYSNLPGVEGKADLIRIMDKRSRKFLQLLKVMVLWNILLLLTWYAYFYLTLKK